MENSAFFANIFENFGIVCTFLNLQNVFSWCALYKIKCMGWSEVNLTFCFGNIATCPPPHPKPFRVNKRKGTIMMERVVSMSVTSIITKLFRNCFQMSFVVYQCHVISLKSIKVCLSLSGCPLIII